MSTTYIKVRDFVNRIRDCPEGYYCDISSLNENGDGMVIVEGFPQNRKMYVCQPPYVGPPRDVLITDDKQKFEVMHEFIRTASRV